MSVMQAQVMPFGLVERLTEAEARALTDRIRGNLSTMLEDVVRAYQGEADKALGYTTWSAYVVAEFPTLPRFSKIERREAVRKLTEGAGMTQVDAGATLGVSERTARDDLQPAVPPVVVDPAPREPEPAPSTVDDKDGQIRRLAAQGMSQGRIATEVHTSKRRVNQVLNQPTLTLATSDGGVEVVDAPVTSGGVVLADAVVEQYAAEAEQGYDVDRLRPRTEPAPRDEWLSEPTPAPAVIEPPKAKARVVTPIVTPSKRDYRDAETAFASGGLVAAVNCAFAAGWRERGRRP